MSSIKFSSGKWYIGDNCIGDVKDIEASWESESITYDKFKFPIKNSLVWTATYDCSNVYIHPAFLVYLNRQSDKLKKKQDLLKPKRISWPYVSGVYMQPTKAKPFYLIRRNRYEHGSP